MTRLSELGLSNVDHKKAVDELIKYSQARCVADLECLVQDEIAIHRAIATTNKGSKIGCILGGL